MAVREFRLLYNSFAAEIKRVQPSVTVKLRHSDDLQPVYECVHWGEEEAAVD
jgi:hypothetical protein